MTSTSKEKAETIRLLKDAKKYIKETEESLFTDKEGELTDYQRDVAMEWLKRQAGIKKNDRMC